MFDITIVSAREQRSGRESTVTTLFGEEQSSKFLGRLGDAETKLQKAGNSPP
jgi:hypothetical protein